MKMSVRMRYGTLEHMVDYADTYEYYSIMLLLLLLGADVLGCDEILKYSLSRLPRTGNSSIEYHLANQTVVALTHLKAVSKQNVLCI